MRLNLFNRPPASEEPFKKNFAANKADKLKTPTKAEFVAQNKAIGSELSEYMLKALPTSLDDLGIEPYEVGFNVATQNEMLAFGEHTIAKTFPNWQDIPHA